MFLCCMYATRRMSHPLLNTGEGRHVNLTYHFDIVFLRNNLMNYYKVKCTRV